MTQQKPFRRQARDALPRIRRLPPPSFVSLIGLQGAHYERRLLPGLAWRAIFAALLSDARRHLAGWLEHHARVPPACDRRRAVFPEKTASGPVSARCRGRTERGGAVRRTGLLPHAANHRHSAAAQRRGRPGARPRRILRPAPEPRTARPAFCKKRT